MLAKGYPPSACEVIWQEKQFSWTHDGKSDQIRTGLPGDQKAVAMCRESVEEALAITTSIWKINYHADYVRPDWSYNCTGRLVIDDHIFYSYCGDRAATAKDSGGTRKAASVEEDSPQIINNLDEKSVVMGKKITTALRKWDPTFKLYSFENFAPTVREYSKDTPDKLPMGVIGDFNGDNISDLAVFGYTTSPKKKSVVLLAVSNEASFRIHVVREFSYLNPISKVTMGDRQEIGLAVYLSILKQSEVKFTDPASPSDVLQVEVWGSPDTSAHVVRKNQVLIFRGKPN